MLKYASLNTKATRLVTSKASVNESTTALDDMLVPSGPIKEANMSTLNGMLTALKKALPIRRLPPTPPNPMVLLSDLTSRSPTCVDLHLQTSPRAYGLKPLIGLLISKTGSLIPLLMARHH